MSSCGNLTHIKYSRSLLLLLCSDREHTFLCGTPAFLTAFLYIPKPHKFKVFPALKLFITLIYFVSYLFHLSITLFWVTFISSSFLLLYRISLCDYFTIYINLYIHSVVKHWGYFYFLAIKFSTVLHIVMLCFWCIFAWIFWIRMLLGHRMFIFRFIR